MTRNKYLLAASTLLLCSCMHNPVPEGYTGALAHIKDSVKLANNLNGDYFFVDEIDGQAIENTHHLWLAFPESASVPLNRAVPARQSTFTIIARTTHSPPIVAMLSTEYEVKGTVTFAPAPNKTYVVKGELGESYSAVWIEDLDSHEVMGNKIEIHGSAKLNFLEK